MAPLVGSRSNRFWKDLNKLQDLVQVKSSIAVV